MRRKVSGAGCPAMTTQTTRRKIMILPVTAMIMATVLLCGSCKRRPLSQVDNNVMVNIDIEKEIVNYTYEEDPSMMRVMFFDNESGEFATHAFLPASGGRVSVVPGRTYHILTYNFDTEYTLVGSEYMWDGIYATTNEIPERYRSRLQSRADENENELIVYEPDHHFVGRTEDFYIPARSVDAPPVTVDLYAGTIVETWLVYVDRIQGMEYVASVSGVISGMALSNTLAADEESDRSSSVFFESLHYDTGGKVDIKFNTFGYNPADRQEISLVITDIGGTAHTWKFDVSDQFVNNPEQIIRINTDQIIIDEPDTSDDAGGGLSPDVDDWADLEIDIEI